LSLLCFASGGYLWHLGEQRARRPAPNLQTNRYATPSNAAWRMPAHRTVPLLSVRAAPASSYPDDGNASPAPAPQPQATPAAKLRLSNTAKPLSDLIRSDRALILRNAWIDSSGAPLEVPAHLRAGPEAEAFLVQANGPVTPQFRAALEAAGVEVVAYIPNNAYLVRAWPGAKDALARVPGVAWVGVWEPYFKLGHGLLEPAVRQQPLSQDTLVEVVGFAGQVHRTQADLEQVGAEILVAGRSPFGPRWVVRLANAQVADLARLPSVQWLERHLEPVPANDLTRVRLGVSTNATTAAPAGQYLALTGRGVRVSVNDSGVDSGHPDLAGRVFGVTNDITGHGTHVIGTILGDGTKSDTVTFASGSTTGANFRGMAPQAEAFVQRVFGMGLALNDEILQETAAATNARLQNNSWFYPAFEYDLHAASFDAAVRDALPDRTGEQPLLVVFAAGDQGRGNASGLGGLADTVQSPGTAKNVITVGAIETPRFITNLVEVGDRTNAPWLGMTDSSNQVAHFSARGNTGRSMEGSWGRFKPDVVAPGAMVISCRASTYAEPVDRIQTNLISYTYANQLVNPASTNQYSDYIRSDAVCYTVLVSSNAGSPVPFPDLTVELSTGPGGLIASGINGVQATVPPLQEGPVTITVFNPGGAPVSYDLTTIQAVTNDIGNFGQVLSNMNAQLGPYYRYESGSSMAAAAVSGLLALMEQYFLDRGLTNSPALMKGLLINGARSLSPQYDLQVRNVINHQGWGLPALPNILPADPAGSGASASVQFVDQDATNALSTGWSHTRTVTVNEVSRSFPLRFTLVWTDPPANPAAGVKLVNNLDLIVTNLDNPAEVYVGNWFQEGSVFSAALGTNGLETNFLAALDLVNNVETIVLQPPLAGTRYSVTVRGQKINVNAPTTARPDRIAQDYALVVSCGNTNLGGTLSLSPTPTIATNLTPAVQTFGTNLVLLLNQRVGANPPYWSTTNGAPEQWSFFVFTNVTAFTNVVIATFLPPNLAFLQANLPIPPAQRAPRAFEADLDLFVSSNPALTNLDPIAIATADRSVGRLGTEMIVYSNATPGQVYYIGVKSEDQQAADYTLFAAASQAPFSGLDQNGNQVVSCIPVVIPDGTPDQPGGTTVVCVATWPMTVQRVVATNTITHENPGDLIGILSHETVSVVLNNHYNWLDDTGGDPTATFIYDDTGEEPGSIPPDGPGLLRDFLGEQAQGLWLFDIVDNALHHTGQVDSLTLRIEPTVQTNLAGLDGYGVYLTRLVAASGWLYSAINVPYDATNLQVCVSAADTVELYVRRGAVPTQSAYDWHLTASAPGGCLDITPASFPPLTSGRYYLAVYNPGAAPIQVTLSARVGRRTEPGPLVTYLYTNSVPLLDDAITNAVILVTNRGSVAMVQVGVRIDHPRVSDLVLHLVSPQGTRILLAENRGLTSSNGYGINLPDVTTNIVATVLDNGFEGLPYEEGIRAGRIIAGWQVDRDDVDVFHSPYQIIGPSHTGTNFLELNGWRAGAISTNISTRVGALYRLSFAYTKNQNRGLDPTFVATADVKLGGTTVLQLVADWWSSVTNSNWGTTSVLYRATASVTKLELVSTVPGNAGVCVDSFRMDELELVTNVYRYAIFTEDTRLTRTPIKFAQAPFVNTNLALQRWVLSDFETVQPTTYPQGQVVDGWTVQTNAVRVVSNPALAYAGTNFLDLGQGSIARLLPTVGGDEYELRLALRADPNPRIRLFNTGVDDAGVALPDNALDPHYQVIASTAPSWPGPNVYAIPSANMPPPPWWVPNSSVSRWITLDPSSANVSFPAGRFVYRTTVDLTEVDPTSVRIRGQWAVDDTGLDILVNSVSTGYTTPAGGVGSFHGFTLDRGFVRGTNTIDFVTTNVSFWHGLRVEFTNITAAPAPGFVPTARAELRLGGLFTNPIVALSNWDQVRIRFVAVSNGTGLELAPTRGWLWLDQVELVETGNRYWLPEEPMSPLFGENAFGPWTLEIWDSRLGGAVTNGVLLSWQLQLGFMPTSPPIIVLTNGVPYLGTVPTNSWLYFAVDVPCTNGWMTNTFSSTAPVDVFFNPDTLPTNGPTDVLLVANLVGSFVWNPSMPPLQAGRYYLGIWNPSAATSAGIVVRSDAGCAGQAVPLIDVGASRLIWVAPDAVAFRLEWSGPPRARFQVQYAPAVEGPWLTVPGTVTSATGRFRFIDDGSLTGPLGPTRFYRVVLVP